MKCRSCSQLVSHLVLDLGRMPPSNQYVQPGVDISSEPTYPLEIRVCSRCWLLQTRDVVQASDLFTPTYAYLSSMSESWLAHARSFANRTIDQMRLDDASLVTEVASNDGYLLQYFDRAAIPVLGIEPTASTAELARDRGVRTLQTFLTEESGQEIALTHGRADLVVANNVIAHVPQLHDFVGGLRALMKDEGQLSLEFPSAMTLISDGLFDTIYHEHYSYFSLTSLTQVLEQGGLRVVDVESLPTHGGSLRVTAVRADSRKMTERSVGEHIRREQSGGVRDVDFYMQLSARAQRVRTDFLEFLHDARDAGHIVAGYGAAAKGNTLMNYSGVTHDLVAFIADRSPLKIGRLMPGSGVPIVDESVLRQVRPRYVVVFPWNLINEVTGQLEYVRAWGGDLVTALPSLKVLA